MPVSPDAARALAISMGFHESASCIAVSHRPAWYQTVSAPVDAIQMEVPSARCAISQKNSRRDARRGVSTDPIHTIRVPLKHVQALDFRRQALGIVCSSPRGTCSRCWLKPEPEARSLLMRAGIGTAYGRAMPYVPYLASAAVAAWFVRQLAVASAARRRWLMVGFVVALGAGAYITGRVSTGRGTPFGDFDKAYYPAGQAAAVRPA